MVGVIPPLFFPRNARGGSDWTIISSLLSDVLKAPSSSNMPQLESQERIKINQGFFSLWGKTGCKHKCSACKEPVYLTERPVIPCYFRHFMKTKCNLVAFPLLEDQNFFGGEFSVYEFEPKRESVAYCRGPWVWDLQFFMLFGI